MDTQAILDVYYNLATVARGGGYHERCEVLDVLDSLAWFDNFGVRVYARRMRVICEVSREFDEIPEEHEAMVSHARDYMEVDP